MKLRIERTVTLPDPIVLARHRCVPELGPKLLFFSGGTALRSACPELIGYTHNSIHLITPFDSGGSSAILRKAFDMPAIGDVRNRLLALADQSLHGHHAIYRLFAHRFGPDDPVEGLKNELDEMILGRHFLVADVPDPMRKIIRQHLHRFREFMPEDFDLRKASIGNLILTAGYLENRRNSDVIIYIFTKLVQALGVVRPIINKDLHLAAELEDGTVTIGQHLLTGKEKAPLKSPIKRLWICHSLRDPTPVSVSIRNKIKEMIVGADLICYPMGSFYSSLIANLLPEGVGRAIQKADVPKVFVPNTGVLDPEAIGMTVMDQIMTLIETLKKDFEPEDEAILSRGRAPSTSSADESMLSQGRAPSTSSADESMLSQGSAPSTPLADESMLSQGSDPSTSSADESMLSQGSDPSTSSADESQSDGAFHGVQVTDLVTHILVDTTHGNYWGEIQCEKLMKMGIKVIDMPLVTPESRPFIAPEKLIPLLISLSA